MAGYLGAKPAVNGIYTVDEFTSSGGTTYTLSRAPGTKNNIQVNAGGLAQYPSAYSVSGTTLTLSGVPSGQKVVVRHMGETILYPALDDGIVTNAKLADDAVGLAEMAPGTDGNIITYDASGNPAAVATGTAGQILTSAGAGAPPTFADAAAGGAWAVKSSGSFSTTSELVITSITKTTKVFLNFLASDSSSISVTTSTDGGSGWGGVPYYDHAIIHGQQSSGSLTVTTTENSGMFQLNTSMTNFSNASGSNVNVEFTLHSPESNRAKIVTWDIAYPTAVGQDDNTLYTGIGKGTWGGTTAINAIKLYPMSGTFSAGTYVVLELN